MTNFNNPAIAAASHILDLIEDCGPQEMYQLRGEVLEQTIGVNKSNVDEVMDNAIAFLIDNHAIEKTDDVDVFGAPYTYYDLPEEDDD